MASPKKTEAVRPATSAKRSLPLSRVYQFLEPGPVVLLSTSLKGRANVMTMSWLTMMEFEPPLVGCVISDRNYSYGILKATRECVINVPAVELSGAHSPRLHMFLVVSLTAAIGFIASFLLLRAGMGIMWLRYPLAVLVAYLGFLFLLWVWLRMREDDTLETLDLPYSGDGPGLDIPPFKGGGGSDGGASHGVAVRRRRGTVRPAWRRHAGCCPRREVCRAGHPVSEKRGARIPTLNPEAALL